MVAESSRSIFDFDMFTGFAARWHILEFVLLPLEGTRRVGTRVDPSTVETLGERGFL
jgi:hypothetical protein